MGVDKVHMKQVLDTKVIVLKDAIWKKILLARLKTDSEHNWLTAVKRNVVEKVCTEPWQKDNKSTSPNFRTQQGTFLAEQLP